MLPRCNLRGRGIFDDTRRTASAVAFAATTRRPDEGAIEFSTRRLLAVWDAQSTLYTSPLSAERISEAEDRLGLRLPSELRYLYSVTNGTDGDMDNEGMAIWDIGEEVVRASPESARVLFSDHLVQCWSYSIACEPDPQAGAVFIEDYFREGAIVAHHTLSGFLDALAEDSVFDVIHDLRQRHKAWADRD